MSSTRLAWLLGTNCVLVFNLKLCIGTPTVGPDFPASSAFEHRAEVRCHQSEYQEPSNLHLDNQKNMITSDVGRWAPTDLDLDEEDHEWWEKLVDEYSAIGQQHLPAGLTLGRGSHIESQDMVPLYPSQSQSLPASGFPNGQQDGQVDTTLVSKKRPRDDRSEEWEFHRQAHRMKETQMIDERSGEQSLIPLGHGPQQQESISSIINNRPGEFKMMTISDKTWNPVFSWAGKHLKMNKEKSATVQDFMQRFEEEQQKLNNMLPFQHNYKKIQELEAQAQNDVAVKN
ncbi:hypothetical protein PGT21_027695 [Puccinia graminis f. sp. tritici]|uniref:Uncharacterized protein n=1 Tax=Puccinia graminis f. sp. tritici TaxID=56615 RepID=A0A5B0MGD2_PUCGR|nr:hypothetical protein PGT21_027695 [Puccinia graminis f. sp. tritici]